MMSKLLNTLLAVSAASLITSAYAEHVGGDATDWQVPWHYAEAQSHGWDSQWHLSAVANRYNTNLSRMLKVDYRRLYVAYGYGLLDAGTGSNKNTTHYNMAEAGYRQPVDDKLSFLFGVQYQYQPTAGLTPERLYGPMLGLSYRFYDSVDLYAGFNPVAWHRSTGDVHSVYYMAKATVGMSYYFF